MRARHPNAGWIRNNEVTKIDDLDYVAEYLDESQKNGPKFDGDKGRNDQNSHS